MNDRKKEVAERFLLPERPFVHGMASAFDMFGTLNQGRNEQLLKNLRESSRRPERVVVRSAWREIGEVLYKSMKQYEAASGSNSRKRMRTRLWQ